MLCTMTKVCDMKGSADDHREPNDRFALVAHN